MTITHTVDDVKASSCIDISKTALDSRTMRRPLDSLGPFLAFAFVNRDNP